MVMGVQQNHLVVVLASGSILQQLQAWPIRVMALFMALILSNAKALPMSARILAICMVCVLAQMNKKMEGM